MRWLVLTMAITGMLVLTALTVPGARAAELVAGNAVTVTAGELLDDDLYAMGSAVEIAGEVTRDVFAMAGTVTIDGRVGGDVTAMAGTIRTSGPVAGSLRVAGGTIEVTGPIGWDLAVLGAGSVTVGPTATVAHDVALLGGGSLTLEGTVNGDVRGNVSTLVLRGHVKGDVDVTVDRLDVADGAQIDGVLRYRSPQPASIAPGARIAGAVEYTPVEGAVERPRGTLERVNDWLSTVLLRLGWALVAGTLLVLAFPRQTTQVTDTLRRAPLWTLLWGSLIGAAVPLIVLVMALTVIGLAAALLLLGVYVAVLYLSQVLVGIAVLRWLPMPWVRSPRRQALWPIMLVGTVLAVLWRLLPLPYGWTIWWSILYGVLALGMVWTALTGWGLRPAAAAAAVDRPLTGPAHVPEPPEVRAQDDRETQRRQEDE